jgi:hypothetical protein
MKIKERIESRRESSVASAMEDGGKKTTNEHRQTQMGKRRYPGYQKLGGSCGVRLVTSAATSVSLYLFLQEVILQNEPIFNNAQEVCFSSCYEKSLCQNDTKTNPF